MDGGCLYAQEWNMASRIGQEKPVREAIAQTAAYFGISPERLDDMLTAVTEACLNAAEHGNAWREESQVNVVADLRRPVSISRL